MKLTVILILIDALGPQMFCKNAGGIRNQRKNRDHPNYCIAKNGWNIQKKPETLKQLAVIQSPVKDHRRKFAESNNNNNNVIGIK